LGLYPEVVANPQDETEILSNITSSYLCKDVLSLAGFFLLFGV
jgi:hypothetical protein